MSTEFQLSPFTIAATASRPERSQGSPVNPPITLSSTYYSLGQPDGSMLYARWSNESWHPAEELVARLEGSPLPGLLFSSGMAAVAATMHLNAPGAPIVIPKHSYHASLIIARDRARREVGAVREVDIADTAAVIKAITSGGRSAGLVWIESPTNPMLEIADIPAIASAAHEVGAIVCVDNTFATPLGQKPLAAGADVVIHSATKYLSGHSDVVAGAAVTASEELRQALHEERTNSGGVVGPMEAWLLLRGMRTLPLRMERIWQNAAELARRLDGHPLVAEVSHPSLPSHPQHERAKDLMSCFGGVLTMRPEGGKWAAEELGQKVEIWLPATSLGGIESSFERRRRFPTEAPTVPEDLLRMSVGVEDVDDLWRDLEQALEAVHGGDRQR
ncbi:MAG: aminotransferase class I/II-fold pyridoxal phosphate-dependent enzyme [Actinomycetaceae bacterium]|nr:aminotransferase class I/II-fold pyridoxal phosphate-dependent enzyme [Actinomycetaceae bacterium]